MYKNMLMENGSEMSHFIFNTFLQSANEHCDAKATKLQEEARELLALRLAVSETAFNFLVCHTSQHVADFLCKKSPMSN